MKIVVIRSPRALRYILSKIFDVKLEKKDYSGAVLRDEMTASRREILSAREMNAPHS